MKGLVVTSSYTADLIQFLSVLTGQEFYVREHRDAFTAWHPRLSASADGALAEVLTLLESPYLGPAVILPLSAVPGFAAMPPQDLLADPELSERHFRRSTYYDAGRAEREGFSARHRRVCLLLLEVVQELEALGFGAYWEAERAPAIEASAADLQRTLDAVEFDLARAVADLLGPSVTHRPADAITLILCSFVAPHGVKVCGPVFLADIRYPHPNTVRQALHELFHPPYREDEVAAELAALSADPLVQSSFDAQDPVYRYGTLSGWIEDNVVEAMAHLFAREAGFADDPVARSHIEPIKGDYKLGAVLLAYMQRIPKRPAETFAAYFRRLVATMPVGQLEREHAGLSGSLRL